MISHICHKIEIILTNIFSKVLFDFESENGESYTIHIELVDKVRSCRRKLGTDGRFSHGDDMIIETIEPYFKSYNVEIRYI